MHTLSCPDLFEALAISVGSDPSVRTRLLECFELQKDFSGEALPPSHTAVLEALHSTSTLIWKREPTQTEI
jgi:hypothetical protein